MKVYETELFREAMYEIFKYKENELDQIARQKLSYPSLHFPFYEVKEVPNNVQTTNQTAN